MVCKRWCAKDGRWQSGVCVWKMVGDKVVCERWCVWKMVCERWCVTKCCVKDGVWKMVCDKVVCERWWVTKWCVKDGGWQSCVWKMVADKVVCERWWVTKWCVKYCVCVTSCGWQRWRAEAEAEAVEEEAGYRIKNKNPTQRCGECIYVYVCYVYRVNYILFVYIYNHSSCSHWTPCQNEASLRPRCARCGLLHLLPGAPRRGVSGGSAGHAAAAAGQWRGRAQCGKW